MLLDKIVDVNTFAAARTTRVLARSGRFFGTESLVDGQRHGPMTTFAEQLNYGGSKVYRVRPAKEEHLKALTDLKNSEGFDFWSPIRRDGEPVEVMVNPDRQEAFVGFLEKNSIGHEVLIDDVDKIFVEERMKLLFFTPETRSGDITFTRYHRHAAINAYLDRLAKDYPDLVTVQNIGKSYEGRDLNVLKISTNFSAGKPAIFIDAGIHAREWIAPPVALYAINQLVETGGNANLLEKVDWHVLPVLNPDGYEYSHDRLLQRLWRKTRSRGTSCAGVDANRNFDFHWAETGSSNNECAQDYHGKRAFSEPETAALSKYILENKDRIKLYLTFHSFGQLILYPWGYTKQLPKDNEELLGLGKAVADSIGRVSGTKYEVGSSTNVLYAAAGGSDDWVKAVAVVELSYTIELPRGGLLGFDVPPWRILPVVRETWEGIKTFHDYIAKKFI